MIKVEQQIDSIAPEHTRVVFASKKDSDDKDLSKAIGRFDEQRRAIALLKGTKLGDKYKALMDGGFQVYLAKDDRNNYYVTDLLDSNEINESYGLEHDDIEREVDSNTGEHDERPAIYKEEQAFLEQDIDSAMDLDFTTEDLKFGHRVGLYNEYNNTYTLREDVKDFLEDFEFDIDETEDGVVAHVLNESINARKLIQLVRLLKQQEQDDVRESFDSNRVQVNALAKVKSLLSMLRLAQKHGDIEESEKSELELNELLDTYRDANPPAQGIEEVEVERDEILTKSESFKRFQERSKPSAMSIAVKRAGKKAVKATGKAVKSSLKKSHDNQMRSAESLDERLKKQADKARATMDILEACGVQVRGQVFNG
ncbi:hypothetical protein VoSk93_39890 [Vibrio owensii]